MHVCVCEEISNISLGDSCLAAPTTNTARPSVFLCSESWLLVNGYCVVDSGRQAMIW